MSSPWGSQEWEQPTVPTVDDGAATPSDRPTTDWGSPVEPPPARKLGPNNLGIASLWAAGAAAVMLVVRWFLERNAVSEVTGLWNSPPTQVIYALLGIGVLLAGVVGVGTGLIGLVGKDRPRFAAEIGSVANIAALVILLNFAGA